MRRVIWREPAERDLRAQWVWYANNGSEKTADEFLEAVERTVGVIASHPFSGTLIVPKDGDLEGLRRFPVTSPFRDVLVFYEVGDDFLEVIRVLHGNRNLRSILGARVAPE